MKLKKIFLMTLFINIAFASSAYGFMFRDRTRQVYEVEVSCPLNGTHAEEMDAGRKIWIPWGGVIGKCKVVLYGLETSPVKPAAKIFLCEETVGLFELLEYTQSGREKGKCTIHRSALP